MTSIIEHVALVYVIAAVVFGCMISIMDQVSVTSMGKPIRFPRLAAGIVGGMLWPLVFWLLVKPTKG